ncbi:uncharacterized protein LOC133825602 [Humulus lupulus]|uniref:uncharacterized protein LOC133825602 n=1 Tax=Humulus lupulus TaxID=3486 RepID=UPI002B40E38B|nr:uncharacterized protein LOC133825602 [Humulus lupulus]
MEDMLRACVLDFQGSWTVKLPLIEFAYNNSYHDLIKMDLYEVLYGRKCQSPIHWQGTGERKFLGSEEVDQATEDIISIRQRLQTTIDRQHKYADCRRRPLEFEVGDKILLKIAPLRGAMRFVKNGKLSLRYIGRFEVLECIGKAAYPLVPPPAFSRVHDVFHVSTLRKYVNDATHVLSYDDLGKDPQLSCEEKSVAILDQKDKVLRNKAKPLVKV